MNCPIHKNKKLHKALETRKSIYYCCLEYHRTYKYNKKTKELKLIDAHGITSDCLPKRGIVR